MAFSIQATACRQNPHSTPEKVASVLMSFGGFVSMSLDTIDTWFPSSKTCSACGHVLEKLKLSTRKWTCPHCGKVHDRDINAAINIKRQGIVQLKAAGLTVLRTKKQPVVARGSL